MQKPLNERLRLSWFEKAAISFIVGFIIWLYYPALSLPLSLVDDYVKLHNLDRLLSDYRTGGTSQVVQKDISIVNRTYNLGFYLLTALQFGITGGQPFHWLTLFKLAFICGILFSLVRQVLPCKKLAGAAGLLSVFLFAAGNVPGAVDMHGLRSNWYRLFATDADGLVFVAMHLYCLIQSVRRHESKVSWLWAMGAGLSGFLAATIKIPYIALIVTPLATVTAVAFVSRQQAATYRVALATGIMVVLFSIFYISMRAIAVKAGPSSGAYGENVSFTISNLWEGTRYYIENFAALYGPMLPALTALIVILGVYYGKSASRKTSHCLSSAISWSLRFAE